MAIKVDRGIVHFTIPDPVNAGVDKVKASTTVNLINIILTLLNERDAINMVKEDLATLARFHQLEGIVNKASETELKNAQSNTKSTAPVYAKDINSVIKYTNELVTTCGARKAVYKDINCEYAIPNTKIIKYKPETPVPDVPQVDQITGEPILDPNGNPIMVPGLKNPIPLLDSNGDPCYYTKTGEQIFVEGPVSNTDETSIITACGNTNISCPNRATMTNYDFASQANPSHVVYSCTHPARSQLVYESASGASNTVPSVNPGDMIKAETFNKIISNLIAVNNAIDSYRDWWDGACNGACQITCQVSCQKGCQVTCQHCFYSTCHNQNCGGFS